MYKDVKKLAKKAVTLAKSYAYERLYQRLETKKGEKDVFKLARARGKKTRELGCIRCIKGQDGMVLVVEAEIRARWRSYISKLFNVENEFSPSIERGVLEGQLNDRACSCISKEEVKEALGKMKCGKAVGLDLIPMEVWKCLGEVGLDWLTKLFNVIFRTVRMPSEWRTSRIIPLYKDKGDVQECNNYQGIKLLSHTMKLWERVTEGRLRKEVAISDNRFSFMLGRSTTEAIHLPQRLKEMCHDRKKDLHMVFIDLEKPYNRVPYEVLGSVWRRRECQWSISELLRICMRE